MRNTSVIVEEGVNCLLDKLGSVASAMLAVSIKRFVFIVNL